MQYVSFSPQSILTALIEEFQHQKKLQLERSEFESFYFNKLAGKKVTPECSYTFRKNLKRLQQQGYLKLINHHNKMEILLTQKGRLEEIISHFKNAPKYPNGFNLIITFDIPHSDKTVRDQFRQFLKENGFVLMQKSVWITNRQLFEQVKQFIHEYDIEQWVNMFESNHLFIGAKRP